MENIELFTAALNIEKPWKIDSIRYEDGEDGRELHIDLSYPRGTKFAYEGKKYSLHDHQKRTWRHLDFFQYKCYLHAKAPRVKTEDGSVRRVALPWTEPGSSFTIYFEEKALSLVIDGLNLTRAGNQLRISGKSVMTIVKRAVIEALASQDLKRIKELSLDETSRRKGHNYFTVLCDRIEKKVVGLSIGKDKEAVSKALEEMEIRGAMREDVKTVSMDMSRSYIAAAGEYLENAEIVFDRFHIMKKMNEALDAVRKAEHKNNIQDFKSTKYYWLKNSNKLNEKQAQKVSHLSEMYPNVGQVYRLKELLRDVLDKAYTDNKLVWLNEWINQALVLNIPAVNKFVNMLHNHWYGIKTYFKKVATNAFAERVNLKIQEIKRAAKGFKNINNFKIMIYLHLGKLDLAKSTNFG